MNVIIMAGGAGTRFWPMSRLRCPKQFLKIFGPRSLVEETFLRVAPLVEQRNIYIIVSEIHRALTEEVFKGREVKIVTEPLARNTAPCIGLGLIHILKDYGDGPVIVLPADHYIGNVEAFQDTTRRAVALVTKGGIATIGIVPTRPETGYGYIKAGKSLSGEAEAFRVEAFVEKPSLGMATQLLSEGGYYWNAGIFVFQAQTMMEEIRRCLPELYEGLMYLRDSLGKEGFGEKLREVYQKITPISIDYGVMERATSEVFVIPGRFPWSDVGSWQAIFELRSHERNKEGNLVDGNAIVLDCKNTFVQSRSERLIGCIGLEDIIIVDTSDALLICHQGSSQDVCRVVELIKERGLEELI
ncbi:MAG: mannose-1-phosphate guanylyltransferase [Deltaproteobacteria bacterium]|nr:mannose-1-phosphate guanylyltransferase [Deltaproteobacteria bacterium]